MENKPKKIRPRRKNPHKWRGMKKLVVRQNITSHADKLKRKRMKSVRPGETPKQWEARVRRFNLCSEKEIEKKLNSLKFRTYRKKLQKKNTVQINKKTRFHLLAKSSPKPENYLKFYGSITTYYCIKYGVKKEDLEIMYMFYENQVFNKERFDNVAVIVTGDSKGVFQRFFNNGYLRQMVSNFDSKKIKKGKKELKTLRKINNDDLFQLSYTCCSLVDKVYLKLSRLSKWFPSHIRTEINLYPGNALETILEMNAEVEEYRCGLKEQLGIEDIENENDEENENI